MYYYNFCKKNVFENKTKAYIRVASFLTLPYVYASLIYKYQTTNNKVIC
jgi:hypothetical protein